MRNRFASLLVALAALLGLSLAVAGPAAAATYVGFSYQTSCGSWAADPTWRFELWNRDIYGHSVTWLGSAGGYDPAEGKIGSNLATNPDGQGYVENAWADVDVIEIPANWRMELDYKSVMTGSVYTVTVSGPRYVDFASKDWIRVEKINTNCGC